MQVDGPAIEWADGHKEWYLHGKLHRDNGPAVEFADGDKFWYLDEVRLTEEQWKTKLKNKVIKKVYDDRVEYTLDGKLHREDGPAVEYANGAKMWYLHGKLHREDGPAIEYANGNKYWYLNDKFHRENGPAIEYADGSKEWYLNGVLLTEEQLKNQLKEQLKEQSKNDVDIFYDELLNIDYFDENLLMERVLEMAKIENLKIGDRVKVKFGSNPADQFLATVVDNSSVDSLGRQLHGTKLIVFDDENPFARKVFGTDIANAKKSGVELPPINGNRVYAISNFVSFAKMKPLKSGKKLGIFSDAQKSNNTFFDMIKSDGVKAGYRVAATQITNGTKAGVLKLLESKGQSSENIKAISDLLDTEVGSALMSMMIGMGLTYAPGISDDSRVQKLAGEFRVNGMAIAGNAAMETMVEYFLPVITEALASIPQETKVSQVSSETEEETEEEEAEVKSKTKKRMKA